MTFKLSSAISKAADLTRASKLREATRVIQSALSGGAGNDLRPAKSGARARLDAPTVNLKAQRPEAKVEAANRRPKRPLADVVETLLRAKRDGAGPLTKQRVKPRRVPNQPEGAQFLSRTFANAAGARAYKLYVPARPLAAPRALIVMLHGCTQDPDDFAIGTSMNELAEEQGFLVAYPAQSRTANQQSCWNWFDPNDQLRDRGEPSIIAGIAREIAAEFNVDPARIFAAGLSAGGAMAAVMGATYPDLFSAIGIHSGLAYGAATDVPGAFMAMRNSGGMAGPLRPSAGPKVGAAVPVRTIVFHGDADQTVHPSNADRIIAGLQRKEGAGARERETGVANGRAYSRSVIRAPSGLALAEHWVVEGAGHAWSGGDPSGSYADGQGPHASREMVRFFLQAAEAAAAPGLN